MRENHPMTRQAKAYISWVPRRKGGMKAAPVDRPFRADVLFQDDPQWPQQGWTLVVAPIRSFKHRDAQFSYANISFLVDDAPVDLFVPGNRFQLFDGRQVIAHGRVAPARARTPKAAKAFESTLLS